MRYIVVVQILTGLGLAAAGVLAIIWLGYPATMAVVARVAGRPIRARKGDATRSVSVILATRADIDAIRARVANLLESSMDGIELEILVALDAVGTLATPEEVNSLHEQVRAVPGDMPGGKAAALNAGVRAAVGDILVMADVAQRFDRETIVALVAHLEDERFGAVSGALDLGREGRSSPADLYWRLEKRLRYHEACWHSAIGVTGAVYATRRRLWPPIPEGALLDDVYVPMRLVLDGHRVGFTYAARAVDTRVIGATGERARKSRTLTGVLQLGHLLPDLYSSRNPVRANYVAHKLLRLTTPLWLVIIALASAAHVAVLALRYPWQVGSGVMTLLVLILVVRPLRLLLFSMLAWLWQMQLAIVEAISNGARGRWSVWRT